MLNSWHEPNMGILSRQDALGVAIYSRCKIKVSGAKENVLDSRSIENEVYSL